MNRLFFAVTLLVVLLFAQGCGNSSNVDPVDPSDLWVALSPIPRITAGASDQGCIAVLSSRNGKDYADIRNPRNCGKCLIADPNYPLQLDPQLWSIGGKFWAAYTVHTQAVAGIGLYGYPQYTGTKWGMSWSDDLINWHWGAVDMTGLLTQLGYDPASPNTIVGAPSHVIAPNCLTGDPAQDYKCVSTFVFVGPNFNDGIYSLAIYAAHPQDGNFNTASYPTSAWHEMVFPPNDKGHGPTDTFYMWFHDRWYMITGPDGYWEGGSDFVDSKWTWKGYVKTLDGTHLPKDVCLGGTSLTQSDSNGHWIYTCMDVNNAMVTDYYTAANDDIFSGWVYQGQLPTVSSDGFNGIFPLRRHEPDLIHALDNVSAEDAACAGR
jgi:hypothetical protein